MAQTIKIKRSATSGNKLTGSNSVAGEIGMNTADKSLYIQTGSTDSSVVTIYDDSILHLDDTNNRVGIGTTSPTYHFHVDAGNNNSTARFESDGVANVVVSGGTNRGSFVVQHSGTTSGALIAKSGGGLEFGVGANFATNVRMVLDSNGAVTFNNAFTLPTAIGSAGQVLKVPTSGTTLYWADESAASTSTLMSDADGDTKIQVEESADEDKIRFDTAGTERMIITDAGNVGIGTTSPTSKLEVHGTTTLKSQLDFLSPDGTDTISASMLNTDTLSFTGDSGQLFSITDSSSGTIFSVNDISGVPSIEVEDDGTIRLAETFGNVGIGLETPSKKLEVSGDFAVTTSTSSNAAYIRNSGTGAALVVNQQGTGDILRVDDNSTTKLVVKDGGRVGIGTASPGYDLDVNGQIHGTAVYVDGYINHTGDSDTYIQYSTDTIILSAGAQETYFKGDGNVGIGTSSPATNLEVAGSAAKLRITDTRDQTFTVGDIMSSIEFDSDDTSGGAGTSSEPRAAINMYAATTFGSSTGLSFHTKSDITSYPTKQMVITNLGRVGIATDSPSDPLHVVGAIRSEGSTTSKYLKVAGGNTGNFIDSHGNDLYLRPNGTTGQALVVRQGGTTEVNSTLTVKPADIGGVTPPTLTAGQLTNSYQVGLSSSLHLSMKVTSSSGNFYWYPTSSTPIAILRQNGDFTLGSTNADNYVNTGSYFKPDTSGKFLAVTGSAHGGFLMLESSTVTDNDQIGGVFFTASAGQSDAHRQVAGIDAIVDAHSTNTALSGADLRFFTKNVGSGLSDPRMTIRSSGQVGIGTTTPGVPLDVNGVIRAVAGDAATSAYSITSNGGDLVLKAGADDVVLRTGGSGSEGIYFQDGAQDTKMFINAENGQVGIGTTSPSYNLDIQTTTGTGLNVTDDNDWATIRVDGGGGTDNVLELTNYGNTGSGSIIRTTGSGHLRLYAGNTEAIRIDGSNQKVGIGVTLPAENLDVTGAVKFRGSSADSTVMHLGRYSDNANTSLVEVICEDTSYDKLENYMKRYGSHFEWTRTSPAGKVAVMHVYSGGGDAKLDLWHQPNTSNSAVERRVRLFTNGASYLNGGNVGIGTSSPSHKLHVVGDIGVNDNNKIKLGGSGDLELYHSATDSYIINNTGHTYLRSDEDNKDVIIQARLGTGGNLAAYFIADSSDQAAKLYHGGYQKFATISNGIRVSSNNYGRIQISDTDNTGLDAFLDKSGINLNITSRFNTGHGGITLRRYNGSTTLTSFAVDEIGDSKFYRDNGSTIGAVFDASTGRFGIGTTTPSEALHVAGDVQIDGSVNTGSNVALLVGGSGNSTIKTRHVDGKDYQSTSDGTLHLNYYVTDNVSIASGGGKVQIGSGVPLARLQVEEAGIDTLTTSTSSASQVAIDTFNKGHFRSAEFTIQVTNTTTSKYHLTKILLIHDGTTPNITEYGTIFTGTAAEATFDADISGNNVRLLATPASANSMTFKVVRHCITV